MKWIQEEILAALDALKQGSTWLVIGVIAFFGLITYSIFQFAIQTDSAVRHLKNSMAACRELTNGPIIILFCGMIFFLFAAAVTLGEVQRYYHFRTIGSKHEMRQAMKEGVVWGIFSVVISVGGLIFFNMNCS